MVMRVSLMLGAALGCLLGYATPLRAQITAEQYKVYMQLLQEKDGPAAYAKRLKLIGDALEKDAAPKPPGSYTSHQASTKYARVPVADALPFLIKFLGRNAEITKRSALRMIGEYGADAAGAAGQVRLLMDDPIRGVREDAMLTLGRIVPNDRTVAAAVVTRLGAPRVDDSENRAAVRTLILMAKVVDKSAAGNISKFREHRWTEVCMYAHEAVGKILDLPRPTLQQLRDLEYIDWRGPPDQGFAVFAAIQAAGPAAEFTVPLLTEMLITNPPTYIQCAIFDCLGKVNTGNPRMIALLLERLVSEDLVLRSQARLALGHIDLKAAVSVRAMAKGLRHAARDVRFEATVKLRVAADMGKITPAGLAEVRTPLVETLKEVNDDVSVGLLGNYLMLLRHLGRSGEPAAGAMLKLYQSDTYFAKQKVGTEVTAHWRGKLMATLANIGVPKEGRPVVLEVLKKGPGDNNYAYAAAARAVGTFGPEGRDAVPWLTPALKADSKEAVHFFIDWSGKGGGFRPTSARLEAIRALAAIGPDAKAALPQLKEIAARKAGPAGSLDAIIPQEARRAVAAIESEARKD